MYVCICNAVTDHRIREAVAEGKVSFEILQETLGVANCCGCCESEVREILAESLDHSPPANRLRPAATHPTSRPGQEHRLPGSRGRIATPESIVQCAPRHQVVT
ncbi:MAG: bacterioferritin-associated ferredoxin [Gammaproteobacteria bacterium]